MTAYYNEINPYAAACLRGLVKAKLIAPGVVDERSIEDVRPGDLAGFAQCHFFAGIGVWSLALRLAGWPDDRPAWTGSCPCQPFSSAGKGAGFADERHLWPAFYHLISQCRPDVVFGEQVASKDGLAWFDLVQADMEGADYACGAIDTCAAGFGAPHIRQRLYWVADAIGAGLEGQPGDGNRKTGRTQQTRSTSPCREHRGMAHTAGSGRREEQQNPRRSDAGNGAGQAVLFAGSSRACGVADAYSPGLQPWERVDQTERYWNTVAAKSLPNRHGQSRPTNGFWGAADWLLCRDGKWRPVESGTFPLAHGSPARVGRLRGYGNAIVAPQAQGFIEAYLEVCADRA